MVHFKKLVLSTALLLMTTLTALHAKFEEGTPDLSSDNLVALEEGTNEVWSRCFSKLDYFYDITLYIVVRDCSDCELYRVSFCENQSTCVVSF